MHFYHKVFKVKVQYLAFINSSLRFSSFPSTGLGQAVHSCNSEKLHSSIFHGDNIPATLQEVSVGQFASGSHAKYSEQNNSFFPWWFRWIPHLSNDFWENVFILWRWLDDTIIHSWNLYFCPFNFLAITILHLYISTTSKESPCHWTSEKSSLLTLWGKMAIVWGKMACNE